MAALFALFRWRLDTDGDGEPDSWLGEVYLPSLFVEGGVNPAVPGNFTVSHVLPEAWAFDGRR